MNSLGSVMTPLIQLRMQAILIMLGAAAAALMGILTTMFVTQSVVLQLFLFATIVIGALLLLRHRLICPYCSSRELPALFFRKIGALLSRREDAKLILDTRCRACGNDLVKPFDPG